MDRLSLLHQPARLVVKVEYANACFITVPGQIASGVHQLDDVAPQIVDIPLFHCAVGRGNLDKAVDLVIFVGIARAVVGSRVVVHGLNFLDDIPGRVIEDALYATVRINDPNFPVIGIVLVANTFTIAGLRIVGIGVDFLDNILRSITQSRKHIAQRVDTLDLFIHFVVHETGAFPIA